MTETAERRMSAADRRMNAADRRMNTAVTLVCVVALGVVVELHGTTWSSMPVWWRAVDVAVGAVAIVVLWWRQRHPLAVALVLGVVGGVSLSATLPILVGIWTLATLRPVRLAALAAGAHLLVGIPYALAFPVYDGPLLGWALVLLLLYTVIVTAGAAVRSRRQVVAGALQEAERNRREYAVHMAEVRRQERARIAREMHDVLAHRISLLSMHAGALQYRTAPGRPDRTPIDEQELHDSVTVIRDAAHRAAEELRDVLSVLRADTGDADEEGGPQPRLTDLPQLVDEARSAGQRVELHNPSPESDRAGELRESVQRTAFRVVQEGLTNARKHAPGARVNVVLTVRPGHSLRIAVQNPLPVGVTESELASRGSGTGLTGLTERTRIEGGELLSEVREGTFVVEAVLPWRT